MQRIGKGLACFIEPTGILQSSGVIKMSPGTGRKIGRDHRDAIKFAPSRVRLPKPERSQRNDENAYPFCSVQRPARKKTIGRNIRCAATTNAKRLASGLLAYFPNKSVVIKM